MNSGNSPKKKKSYPNCDPSMNSVRHKSRSVKFISILNKNISTFKIHFFLFAILIALQPVNSNTTNMNANKFSKEVKFNPQKDVPNQDNNDDSDGSDSFDYAKVNLETDSYYDKDFVHLSSFYNGESTYSNYDDYKKFFLNPSNPLPQSKVKFKISNRIVQTRYGKLQGIVLAMDEHRYLSPLEVFLGVPYATPPVGSNRYLLSALCFPKNVKSL